MSSIYVKNQEVIFDADGLGNIQIYSKPNIIQLGYPSGKGILIWKLTPNILATVNKLVDLGIKWVAPKVVNAVSQDNSLYINSFIIECRKVGIDVWGWGYTYGVNPAAEGLQTATIINNLDISGYFIDVEGEYDKPGMTTTATLYMNNLRPNTKKSLGLCSYRYPSLHANVPWKIFLDGCDFHIPQVYWIQATSDIAPGYQLGRSYNQLQAIKQLPFIALGTIVKDDNSAWVPSPAQVTNFYNTAKQMNLPGYSYYDLDSGLPNLLDVVKTQN